MKKINITALKSTFDHKIQFHYFYTIDSTQTFLKNISQQSNIECCIAEEQTQGRGRMNRAWYSPPWVNLYFSIKLPIQNLKNISCASLVIGLSLVQVIRRYVHDKEIMIKWPNDILCQNQKIAGILTEYHDHHLIVGIGININAQLPEPPNPNKPWGSLFSITGKYFDRTLLLSNLVHQIILDYEQFCAQGFAPFQETWLEADYLHNKNIEVIIHKTIQQGIAQGVTPEGKLILKSYDGESLYLISGETSLLNFGYTK